MRTCSSLVKPRTPVRLLLAAAILFLSLGAAAQAIRRVTLPTITVSDLDRVLPFYTEVLSFRLSRIEEESGAHLAQLFGLDTQTVHIRVATLHLGREQIRLLDFLEPAAARPVPPDSRSNDLWFQHLALVTRDMDAAYRRLREQHVQHVSTAPQTLPGYLSAAAGIRAFYFRDPDGHNLEAIWYPPGKGQERWHQDGGPLFLGIDHTAIGVDDTRRSLSLYQDLLGLDVLGASENYGPEQERLNQVFGAHLDITGLGAGGGGIGVEFLDYLAPPGGRPFPGGSRVTDLWHWHTTLVADDVDLLRRRLSERGYSLISRDILPAGRSAIFPGRCFLLRDPDGHALLITTQANSSE